jgi:energy-converting hydrogenase Eha subunit A
VTSAAAWPIIVGVLVAFLAGWITSTILDLVIRQGRPKPWLYRNSGNISLAVAMLAMVMTAWYLWL